MLFALDIGNKQVKLKSEKVEKVLPSYFIETSQYGNRDLLAFAKKKKDSNDYNSIRDKDFTYSWGTELDVESISHVVDASGFGLSRYKSREFQLLVDFALAELAKDYEESSESLRVNVVTGLPTDDYKNQSILAAISGAVKGAHVVNINNKTINVFVDTLHIIPQSLGTVTHMITDDRGQIKDNHELTNANMGIVDLGGGTVLIDALRSLNFAEDNRAQLSYGAYSLYKMIIKELSENGYNISEYELEKVIRSSIGDRYVWSPDNIQNIDITDTVVNQIKIYTRQIASSIKSTYKGFGRIQKILLTGGAANLIHLEEIQKELYDLCHLVPESELANLRGFYKYGLAQELSKRGNLV